ncbi:MAG: serine/threonine protein kinase [Planctomycetota bacterium]|jgi:serine/threonine-protein kinase
MNEAQKNAPVVTPEAEKPERDPLEGQVVGKCRIVSRLGEGGFGWVYRAIDEEKQRPVALKVVKPERASEDVIKKFLRGAIAAAQIDHPNVVAIYKVGRDDRRGVHYLVMEHLRGVTMQAVLEDKGPYEPQDLLPLIIQASHGLHAAHEASIIHRDVKPDNLMIGSDGVLKVTDLGLARILTREMKTTRVMGTPHFMSPEQFEGKGMDRRTDIYSLGMSLFYLLSHHFPYEGKTSMQIVFNMLTHEPKPLSDYRPGLPERMGEIILKMTARPKDARYADLEGVIKDLEAYMAEHHPDVEY